MICAVVGTISVYSSMFVVLVPTLLYAHEQSDASHLLPRLSGRFRQVETKREE